LQQLGSLARTTDRSWNRINNGCNRTVKIPELFGVIYMETIKPARSCSLPPLVRGIVFQGKEPSDIPPPWIPLVMYRPGHFKLYNPGLILFTKISYLECEVDNIFIRCVVALYPTLYDG
jgi:hypothetical protein